jgi:tight adherence protein G
MQRRMQRKDERGAIIVLAAVGLVMAMIFAGLAVDLGFIAQEARTNQKVADLAALDAVRTLPADPTAAAQASGRRNGLTTVTAPNFLVEAGKVTGGAFSVTPLSSATAVRVTVASLHTNKFPFLSSGQNVKRRGVASIDDRAQFSVGSKLATLNPTDNTALNKVMTAILGTSPAINLDVVSYKGLAGGTVSLADLVAADPTLGSPDSLLTSSVSVKKLAQASLTALNNKAAGGDTAAAAAKTPLATFAGNINSTLMVRLGDMLDFEQPADPASAAANAQLNVFDLITGAGEVGMFNGTNAVSIPNFTLGIAGLVSATLKLTIIEPPKISALGPARYDTTAASWVTKATTAQVKVELDTHITVGSCGFLGTCVDLTMPLILSAAKATGSLTDVRCPAGSSTQQADILVDTAGSNATANNVLSVHLLGIPVVPDLDAVSTNVIVAGGTTSPALTFTGPPFPTPIQSTAATGAGLATATQSQLTLLGIIPVGPVLTLLSPTMAAIDNQIFAPVFNALGLSVGGADVQTLRIECSFPSLVG